MNQVSFVCTKCNIYPFILLLHYPRTKLKIECECGYYKTLSIEEYLSKQPKKAKNIRLTIDEESEIKEYDINHIKERIQEGYTFLDKYLSNLKREHLEYANEEKKQLENAYTKCVQDNKIILTFITHLLDNFSKYYKDKNLQKTMQFNSNINTDSYVFKQVSRYYSFSDKSKREKKEMKKKINKQKVKHFINYLNTYTVIDYSFTLVTQQTFKDTITYYSLLSDGRIFIFYKRYIYDTQILNYFSNETVGGISIYTKDHCDINVELNVTQCLVTEDNTLIALNLSKSIVTFYQINKTSLQKLGIINLNFKGRSFIAENHCKIVPLSNNRFSIFYDQYVLVLSSLPPYNQIAKIKFDKINKEFNDPYNIGIEYFEEFFGNYGYHREKNLLIVIRDSHAYYSNQDDSGFVGMGKSFTIWELDSYSLVYRNDDIKDFISYDTGDIIEMDKEHIMIIDRMVIIFNLVTKTVETILHYSIDKGIKMKDDNIVLLNNEMIFVYYPKIGIIAKKRSKFLKEIKDFQVINDHYLICNRNNYEIMIYKYE